MKDRGKWTVGWEYPAQQFYITSDDPTHHAHLYISGDFMNNSQTREYAEDIAKRLSETCYRGEVEDED